MEAKKISLWTMILAAVFAITLNVLMLIFNKRVATTDEQASILMFSGFMIICFSPVYLSIWLEKIFGKKE
jgi:hypothetical protein